MVSAGAAWGGWAGTAWGGAAYSSVALPSASVGAAATGTGLAVGTVVAATVAVPLVVAGSVIGFNAWVDSPVSFPGVNTLTEPGGGTPGAIDPQPTTPRPPSLDPPSAGTPDVPIGDQRGPATLVQAGGKQGEAIEDIEDLIPHVEEHLEKLRQNPGSRDVSHWQDEINTALNKMDNKLKHLGKKSYDKWRAKIDAYRKDPVMLLSSTSAVSMPITPSAGRIPGLLGGGVPSGLPGGIGGGRIPASECRKSLAACR